MKLAVEVRGQLGAEDKTLAETLEQLVIEATEPASSKDTTTLDLRANSPRDSKSIGTGLQRRASLQGRLEGKELDTAACSVSSLSEQGKQEPQVLGLAEHSPSQEPGESEFSNHSRVLTDNDDAKEADSHQTPRAKDRKQHRAITNACSGSYNAQEGDGDRGEIQSRGVTEDHAVGKQPTDAQDVKLERDVSLVISDGQLLPSSFLEPGRGLAELSQTLASPKGTKRRRTEHGKDEEGNCQRETVLRLRVEAGTETTVEGVICQASPLTRQPGNGTEGNADSQSFSRTCSAAPQMSDEQPELFLEGGGLDEEDIEVVPVKKPPRRKPRTKLCRKGSLHISATPRRSSRVPPSDLPGDGGSASGDEDYCPPGELSSLSVEGRWQRGARTRSSAPKPSRRASGPTVCPSPSTISRPRSMKLRGSNSVASLGTPASPTACRRLRSQPLDISCLTPDAFECDLPAKRPKHSALQSGCHLLQHSIALGKLALQRSKASGLMKPRPAWEHLEGQAELEGMAGAVCEEVRASQAADMKLLEGQMPALPDRATTAERLGPSPLSKAVRALAESEAATLQAQPESSDVMETSRRIMPRCLYTACNGWGDRLGAPCSGLMGEITTCLKSRLERDLQNTWDDLLARHALEISILEDFQQWLSNKRAES